MLVDGNLKIGDKVVWRSEVPLHHAKLLKYLHEAHGDGPFTVEAIKPRSSAGCPAVGSELDPEDTHTLTVSLGGNVLNLRTKPNGPMEFPSYWLEKAPADGAEKPADISSVPEAR
jgi:hypothetical protein